MATDVSTETSDHTIEPLSAMAAAVSVVFFYLGSMFTFSNKFVMTTMMVSGVVTAIVAYHVQVQEF